MNLTDKERAALSRLKDVHKQRRITRHQFRTLCGQVLSGDTDAALRGLRKILLRNEKISVSRET